VISSRGARPATTATTGTALFGAVLTLALLAMGATVHAAPARADQVADLVNVTVRPGYNFANADDALNYGQGVCEKIANRTPFGQIMSDVKADFATTDEYQASYLVTQTANELCPAQIWQLRNAAAGYRPPAS
jgi:hypothetical protein